MPDRALRVLIVDDEPLGWSRIADLLADRRDVHLVGVAEDGRAAVTAIRTLAPDLVFLDVQMPECNGLDVVREVGPTAMPATVFVTASDQYAVQAFQLAAVDYLLKPYSDERFEDAFLRARRRVDLEGLDSLRAQMLRLLSGDEGRGGAPVVNSAPASFLERIPVHSRGRMRVICVKDIDYIKASGVYAELHVGPDQYLIRESLCSLEEQLDPEQFFRIHRSEIVHLDRIDMLLRGGGGDYEVQLKNGTRLRVGRSRKEELEQRLLSN
jgi:two-component system, LytTR family, response regulator